tara:strand:- start:478 stop:579 length:102 start_codon:yes stop_codon:yes gene_type:complete
VVTLVAPIMVVAVVVLVEQHQTQMGQILSPRVV